MHDLSVLCKSIFSKVDYINSDISFLNSTLMYFTFVVFTVNDWLLQDRLNNELHWTIYFYSYLQCDNLSFFILVSFTTCNGSMYLISAYTNRYAFLPMLQHITHKECYYFNGWAAKYFAFYCTYLPNQMALQFLFYFPSQIQYYNSISIFLCHYENVVL